MFFNVALEKSIKDARIITRATIFRRSIQLLVCTDDTDIIGRSKQVVVETFLLESAARDIGLIINEHKVKFMAVTSRVHISLPLKK
ncbi:hypothetical protein X975_13736, partial [Stegodyphus mimosarum]